MKHSMKSDDRINRPVLSHFDWQRSTEKVFITEQVYKPFSSLR